MIKIIEKSNCCGCHSCYNICPQNAISMITDDKGFKYPIIDKTKCINCGLCEKVCPILNNKKYKNDIYAYACYNKDITERMKSSSGGVFILIAKEIIKRNGVVFGASFDDKFEVIHTKVTKEEDLQKLMGSKYVQSNIKEIYKDVKAELQKNKYVLFTGTPCQIEGLKYYLMKEYKKLYTQDIVCHGVSSPLVWEKYKKFRKITDSQVPQNINFRNKDDGWENFNMTFTYKVDSFKIDHNEDLFMQSFLRNTILRDSCYNCHFKKINRLSDITLADYWGIEKNHPEMNDNKGISLMIINSSKGYELFNCIKENLIYKDTNLKDAIKYNSAMINSVKQDKNRDNFFNHLEKLDFDILVKKYTYKPSLLKKMMQKGKCAIKKIYK